MLQPAHKLLITCGIFWLLAHGKPALGTTVVLIAGKDEIVIAADSKTLSRTVYVADSKTLSSDKTSSVACKISLFENVAIRTSKIKSNIDVVLARCGLGAGTTKRLDVGKAMGLAMKHPGSWEGKLRRFEFEVKQQLVFEGEFRRDKVPSMFKDFEENHVVEVMIATFGHDGRAMVYWRLFKPMNEGGKQRVNVFREEFRHEDLWGLVIGQCDAIDKFRDQNKGYFKTLDPVTSARMLVQMQIDATPDSVGPPIDIIRLTPNGTEWIQKKPECKRTTHPFVPFN